MNTLPMAEGLFTHFVDRAGHLPTRSVMDYGLISSDNVRLVDTFVIDANARYACGTDHAPLFAVLNPSSPGKIKFHIEEVKKFRLTPSTNYASYSTDLETSLLDKPLSEFEDMTSDEQLSFLQNCIGSTFDSHFLKTPNTRQKPRRTLPAAVIRQIRAQTSLQRQLDEYCNSDPMPPSDDPLLGALRVLLEKQKQVVREHVGQVTRARKSRFRHKLITEDLTKRKFWDFVKNHCRNSSSVTGAYDANRKVVFSTDEVCLNLFFFFIFELSRFILLSFTVGVRCLGDPLTLCTRLMLIAAPLVSLTLKSSHCSPQT